MKKKLMNIEKIKSLEEKRLRYSLAFTTALYFGVGTSAIIIYISVTIPIKINISTLIILFVVTFLFSRFRLKFIPPFLFGMCITYFVIGIFLLLTFLTGGEAAMRKDTPEAYNFISSSIEPLQTHDYITITIGTLIIIAMLFLWKNLSFLSKAYYIGLVKGQLEKDENKKIVNLLKEGFDYSDLELVEEETSSHEYNEDLPGT